MPSSWTRVRVAAAALALVVLPGAAWDGARAADAGPTSPVATTVVLTGPAEAVGACELTGVRAKVTAADGSDVNVRGGLTFTRDAWTLQPVDVVQGGAAHDGLWAPCAEGPVVFTARFADPSGVYAPSVSEPVSVSVVRRQPWLELWANPTVPWGKAVQVVTQYDGFGTAVVARDLHLTVDGVEYEPRLLQPATSIQDTYIRGLDTGRHTISVHLPETSWHLGSGVKTVTVDVLPTHGTFHVMPPTRLLDTRRVPEWCTPEACPPHPVFGTSIDITPTIDRHYGFPERTTAVALNVTSTHAHAPGFLAVTSGDSGAAPSFSTGNLWPGQDVATMTFAGVGSYGDVDVHLGSPSHLVADAVGYWTDDRTGAYVQPLTPTRVLDTRGSPRVGAGDRRVQVVGAAPVPASATAVVLNVTSTDSTGPGFVSARASGAPVDDTSVLNMVHGADRSNLAVVALGPDGAVALRALVSPTHLVADVVGYLSPETGQTTGPLTPKRIFDSRTAETRARAGDVTVQVAGRGGVPEDASGVWLSVTTTQSAAPGHVIVWPGGAAPVASASNQVPGQDIAALTLVPLAPDGTVSVRRSAATHVILDVVGVVDAPA